MGRTGLQESRERKWMVNTKELDRDDVPRHVWLNKENEATTIFVPLVRAREGPVILGVLLCLIIIKRTVLI